MTSSPRAPALTRFSVPLHLKAQFVRKVLAHEVDLRTDGAQFVVRDKEGQNSIVCRNMVNADGSPSEAVASGYSWLPGTELSRRGTVSAVGTHAP